MPTINILIAVDAAVLARQVSDGAVKCGSMRWPTSLNSYRRTDVYLVMLSPYGPIDNKKQLSDLLINPQQDYTIRWSITSFANNFNHSLFFYKMRSRWIEYDSTQVDNYLPAPGDGISTGTVTRYTNQVVTVRSTITWRCSLCFQVIDNATGESIGFFKWNPF